MHIENGSPVYIASLSFPERLVLDHLYLLLDEEKNLSWVSSLSTEELVDTFPEYGFEKVVLMEDEQIWIYRIVRKSAPQKIAALWALPIRAGRSFAPINRTSFNTGGLP